VTDKPKKTTTKRPPTRTAAPRAVPKANAVPPSADERQEAIRHNAYLRGEKEGFTRTADEYWAEAEKEIGSE